MEKLMNVLLQTPVVALTLASLMTAQEVQLLASDGGSLDEFGAAVSLGSGLALCGGPLADNGGGVDAGAAYLFDADPTGATPGVELALLMAADAAPGDNFGEAVSVSDGLALVGAPWAYAGGQYSGAAYLFDGDPASPTLGVQLKRLSPSGGSFFDAFGHGVALGGKLALVGTPYSHFGAGSVYLFDADRASATFGTQLLEIPAPPGASGTAFGLSVALDGGLALVGASHGTGAVAGAGCAYLFNANPASPTFGHELIKFQASDGADHDLFGFSVALADGLALMGAHRDDDLGPRSGSTYLFDANPLSSTFGQELLKLTAPDGVQDDSFGYSVALASGQALVGAWRDDDGGPNTGSAYLFDAQPMSATFGVQLAKLTYSAGEDYDGFGKSVALTAGLALVGVPGDDDNGFQSGGAVLRPTSSAPCAFSNYCQGAPNSAGSGASMGHVGTGSVLANDLVLTATGCPTNQFGIFYYGAGQLQFPFGNGWRCVGSGGVGLFRFPPVNTGASASVSWLLDVTSPPQPTGQINAGSTWHFQFWYRDPLSGGANFNLSDGLRVTFCM
ncbi:MAG: hypothetical protein CMK00_02625 [Planctomycetes bacterium]|jgi:hypothetical protein|nr:hypothetical protein [Planctomycetota bacterium]HJO25614.1 hypothetical protein [Planctomycetota bacterium]